MPSSVSDSFEAPRQEKESHVLGQQLRRLGQDAKSVQIHRCGDGADKQHRSLRQRGLQHSLGRRFQASRGNRMWQQLRRNSVFPLVEFRLNFRHAKDATRLQKRNLLPSARQLLPGAAGPAILLPEIVHVGVEGDAGPLGHLKRADKHAGRGQNRHDDRRAMLYHLTTQKSPISP